VYPDVTGLNGAIHVVDRLILPTRTDGRTRRMFGRKNVIVDDDWRAQVGDLNEEERSEWEDWEDWLIDWATGEDC